MRVFLSYSRKNPDPEAVDRFDTGLRAAGFEVWRDVQGLRGGQEWRGEIVEAIRKANAVVAFVSPNSMGSENVSRELTVAEELQKEIIPVLIRATEISDDLLYILAGVEHIDVSALGFDDALRRLREALADGASPAEPPGDGEGLPILELSTNLIDVGDVLPGEALTPVLVRVENRGAGTLDWLVETQADWLELDRGENSFSVVLRPKPGVNHGEVVVRDRVTSARQTVEVNARLPTKSRQDVPGPRIQPSQEEVGFGTVVVGAAASHEVEVTDGGGGTLTPDATTSKPPQPSRRKRKRVAVGAAVVVVLAIVGVAAALVASGGGSEAVPKVAARIPIGQQADHVAVGGSGVWISDSAGHALVNVDHRDNTTSRVPLESAPHAVAVADDAVWATVASGDLVRVDPQPGSSPHTTVVPVGTQLSEVAAGEGAIWATAAQPGQLIRVDPQARAVVARIPVGPSPDSVVAGEGAVWVANRVTPGTITRVDAATNRVVATIPVGANPDQLAVGAGSVWSANSGDGTVSRIDPATNRVIATIPVGPDVESVTVGQGAVWVSQKSSGLVARIDPVTNEVTTKVRVGGQPESIAAGSGGVWVADTADGEVLRIDPSPRGT